MTGEAAPMEVRVWDESRWLASREEYEALLRRSNADPLYLSWDWQTLWWQYLSPRRSSEYMRVFAAYEENRLVGALAVVTKPVRLPGRISYRATYILGNCHHDTRGVFSEYLDVVAQVGREKEVREACLHAVLRHERCAELCVGVTGAVDEWVESLRTLPGDNWSYTRAADSMTTYQADLSAGFRAYLATLSANARRSMFNLRSKLRGMGKVVFELVSIGQLDAAIQEMNRLHALRWGGPALSGSTLLLHQELIKRWSEDGKIQLSLLKIEEQTVSVLYDIRLAHTQYNIQMGFNPSIDSSISLGLLHLGYAMEHAAQQGVKTYDFLAGNGKRTDYKKRIASRNHEVASIQFLAGPVLALTFRGYDLLRKWRKRVRS